MKHHGIYARTSGECSRTTGGLFLGACGLCACALGACGDDETQREVASGSAGGARLRRATDVVGGAAAGDRASKGVVVSEEELQR